MDHAEGREIVAELGRLDWPDDVDVDFDIVPESRGYVIVVVISGPNGVADAVRIRRWPGRATRSRLTTLAREFSAIGSGGNSPPAVATADDPDPRPDWLQLTLLRISATYAARGSRELARRFATALEADGIPAATVNGIDSGVELSWEIDGRELSVLFVGPEVVEEDCGLILLVLWTETGLDTQDTYRLDSPRRFHDALYEFRWSLDILRGRESEKHWHFDGIGGSDEGRHARVRKAG